MKTFLLILFLFTIQTFPQWNIVTVYDTTGTNDSIFVDLGIDLDYLPLEYTGGSQYRVIAFEMHGTWTNDSLQVYAASHPDSTYYPVYYDGALVTEIATTGSSYIALEPTIYAGIRYLLFKLPANEAANRLYGIVKRQY
jgi:hypothetical protein